jgi:uncharacterized membrane protein YuzA (DUF378 family)
MLNLVIFAKLLLIIGGITFGIYGLFNVNIIKKVLQDKNMSNLFYICIGIAAVFLMFNRNFYLPFLDKTVMPKVFIGKDQKPLNATFSVEVTAQPHSRIIYWASDVSGSDVFVETAYGEFENSGITTADSNGKAHLILKKPESYKIKKIGFNKTLKPHIHYRYSLSNGMMSDIQTRYISNNELGLEQQQTIFDKSILGSTLPKFSDLTQVFNNTPVPAPSQSLDNINTSTFAPSQSLDNINTPTFAPSQSLDNINKSVSAPSQSLDNISMPMMKQVKEMKECSCPHRNIGVHMPDCVNSQMWSDNFIGNTENVLSCKNYPTL